MKRCEGRRADDTRGYFPNCTCVYTVSGFTETRTRHSALDVTDTSGRTFLFFFASLELELRLFLFSSCQDIFFIRCKTAMRPRQLVPSELWKNRSKSATSLHSRVKAGAEIVLFVLFFLNIFLQDFFLEMHKKLHFCILASRPLTVTVTGSVADTQCHCLTTTRSVSQVEISVTVVLFQAHWKEFNNKKNGNNEPWCCSFVLNLHFLCGINDFETSRKPHRRKKNIMGYAENLCFSVNWKWTTVLAQNQCLWSPKVFKLFIETTVKTPTCSYFLTY